MMIRNWEKWQSYRKDRGQPPWIKLHRCLMRDPDWVILSSQERGDLVSLWLLAADRDGWVPDDPAVLQKLCYMDAPPNVSKFIELGFLDANVTPIRRQYDEPEVEVEVEAEKKEQSQKIGAKKPAKQMHVPTVDEIKTWASAAGISILQAETFHDHFTSNGWKVSGRAPMKDWRAAYRNWVRREAQYKRGGTDPLEGTSYAK